MRQLSRRLDQSLGCARGVYIAGLSVALNQSKVPGHATAVHDPGIDPSSAGDWCRHPRLPAAPRHPRYSREPTPPGARRSSEGRTGQGRVWLMSAVGGRNGAPLGLGGAYARPDGAHRTRRRGEIMGDASVDCRSLPSTRRSGHERQAPREELCRLPSGLRDCSRSGSTCAHDPRGLSTFRLVTWCRRYAAGPRLPP